MQEKQPPFLGGCFLQKLSDDFPNNPDRGECAEYGEESHDLTRDLSLDVDGEQGIFILFALECKMDIEMTADHGAELFTKPLCTDRPNGDIVHGEIPPYKISIPQIPKKCNRLHKKEKKTFLLMYFPV